MRSHPKHEDGYRSKSRQKPGVETRRQLAVNTDNFTKTPEVKPSPNVMPSFPLDIVGLAEMCGGIWSRQLSTSTYYRPGLRPGKITPNVISKGENFYQRLCYFYLLLLCALKYPIQCCLLSFRLKDVPVLLNRVMVKATHRLHLGF